MASFGFGKPDDPENIYDERFFFMLEKELMNSMPTKYFMAFTAAWFAKEYVEKRLAVRYNAGQAPVTFGSPGMVIRRETGVNPWTDEPRAFSTPYLLERYRQVCRRVIQRLADEKADPEQNVIAFLRLIRYAEHNKDDSRVYNTLYGGGTFSSYKTHPNEGGTSAWGKKSYAAGAYQILFSTWDEARKNGIVSDFSPASQDKLARHKLETRGALKYVERGDLENAIANLTNEWTSLPGGKESKMTMHEAHELFGQFLCDELYGVKK